MPDAVHRAMNNVKNTVLNIWDNIKNGVWDRVWNIRDTVTDALNSAADSVRNIANSSWQWGYDLMQNLVNGIRYMMAGSVQFRLRCGKCDLGTSSFLRA